jgi:hypothetical protein
MSIIIQVESIDKQIKKINYQNDLNRLAKQRNDKELEKCCDTCKIYIGLSTLCSMCLYLIILIVQIIRFNINNIDNDGSY